MSEPWCLHGNHRVSWRCLFCDWRLLASAAWLMGTLAVLLSIYFQQTQIHRDRSEIDSLTARAAHLVEQNDMVLGDMDRFMSQIRRILATSPDSPEREAIIDEIRREQEAIDEARNGAGE